MASYTEKLKLLKKNPVTDGADTFNIETMMNENWDKIDGFSAFLEASIAPPYSASSAYAVGAWCTHYGKLYQCTTAIGSGGEAWNASHWTAKSTADLIAAVKASIPSAYTSNPAMNGTASPGNSTTWARGNHVHPKDTSKADQSLLDTYVRPNLLDNWYFVGGGSQQGGGQFPVNQRGQTSYSATGGGAQSGIDGWKVSGNASSGNPATISLSNGGLNLSCAAAAGLFQDIEGFNEFAGKTVTLSVYASVVSGPFDLVINDGEYHILGTMTKGNNQLVSAPFTVQNAPTMMRVMFDGKRSPSSLTLYATKLELGDTQTLAHQDGNGNWVLNEIPSFQPELAKCQRKQIELVTQGTTAIGCVGTGSPISTTKAYIFVPLPVELRAVPAIAYSGTWRLARPGHGVGSGETVTAMSVLSKSANGVTLEVTANGLSTSYEYELWHAGTNDQLRLICY